jgi:hypothetical protein
MRDQLGRADGLARATGLIPAVQVRARLLQRALASILSKRALDPRGQPIPSASSTIAWAWLSGRSGAPVSACHAEAAARAAQHLPRATHAGGVLRVDPRHGLAGRFREAMPACPRRQAVRLGADVVGNRRDFRQPLGQGAEIEARAAHDDRALVRPQQRRVNGAQPVAHRILRLERHMTVERWGARASSSGGRRGQDAPAVIDLQRVGVHDDAARRLRDLQRQRGFARCRGPGNQDRLLRGYVLAMKTVG